VGPYRVFISAEVLHLRRPSQSNRERIIRFLQFLSENPFTTGDYQERDSTGRTIETKIIGDYAVTFWSDHAVKEVKVTKIEKADPF
jgi:hypothetical protein